MKVLSLAYLFLFSSQLGWSSCVNFLVNIPQYLKTRSGGYIIDPSRSAIEFQKTSGARYIGEVPYADPSHAGILSRQLGKDVYQRLIKLPDAEEKIYQALKEVKTPKTRKSPKRDKSTISPEEYLDSLLADLKKGREEDIEDLGLDDTETLNRSQTIELLQKLKVSGYNFGFDIALAELTRNWTREKPVKLKFIVHLTILIPYRDESGNAYMIPVEVVKKTSDSHRYMRQLVEEIVMGISDEQVTKLQSYGYQTVALGKQADSDDVMFVEEGSVAYRESLFKLRSLERDQATSIRDLSEIRDSAESYRLGASPRD